MLPQGSRLRKEDEIELVFRIGKTWHTPFFSIKYAPSSLKEGSSGRAAFSFSKKFLKKAVERNRLKRRIANNLQKMPKFPYLSLDMVFYLPKECPFPLKGEVAKELEAFFKHVFPGK
jgi:ribonuclease P protein component